jgi:hypothetical protein
MSVRANMPFSLVLAVAANASIRRYVFTHANRLEQGA